MTLAKLLQTAFPPEWREEGESPEGALDRAVARLGREDRAEAVQELADLRQRGFCDMQLDDLIAYELGSHLRPAELGLTPAAWLVWLQARLQD